MARVPFIGQWKAKVTKIYKVMSVPCAITPQVWALGYFVATPQLLWSLYGPDCLDQAYNRGARKHGAKRTGILNVVAASAPLAAPTGGVGWALFQGAEFAQRLGWYMLLVDSFTEWVLVGTSQALKYSGCSDPNGAYCQLSAISGLQAGLDPGEYLYSYWTVDQERIFNGGFSGVNCPPGYNPSVGVWFQQLPNMIPDIVDCSYQVRIVDAVSGISSPWIDPLPGDLGARIFTEFAPDWGFTNGSHAYRVYIQKSYGVFWIGAGGMSVNGGPKFNLGPSYCAQNPGKKPPG